MPDLCLHELPRSGGRKTLYCLLDEGHAGAHQHGPAPAQEPGNEVGTTPIPIPELVPLPIVKEPFRSDHSLPLVRRKVGDGYEVYEGETLVGYVAKTGTHLDDYPWDWRLADGIEWVGTGSKLVKVTGSVDTLGHGVDEIGYAIGRRYGANSDKK